MSDFWSTTNSILSSLLSTSVAFVMSSSHRRDLEAYSKGSSTLKRLGPRIFTAVDLTVAVPLGYAAYRVYKNGGGFGNTNTAIALSGYGLNMFTCLATTFNSKKIGNFEVMVYSYIYGTAISTALAFYKIDEVASFCVVPYAVWTGLYCLLVNYFYDKQKQNKEE
ncbi:hypothetical protein niasHT_019927 [Heterodera trifolii]|uniref:Uncharacterized protein n=1 Tax=Heterodera trifolii TaxID=157864 RepID=A0ABD2LA25_9BILA